MATNQADYSRLEQRSVVRLSVTENSKPCENNKKAEQRFASMSLKQKDNPY